MTEITAQLVKELRDITGAGMMDCKKALSETNGDCEAAKELLRKKGLSKASQKSDRATSEGVIAVASNDKTLLLLEASCETDFVAKSDQYTKMATDIARKALDKEQNLEELKQEKLPSGQTVEEAISEQIAILGENIKLSRLEYLKLDGEGLVDHYLHNAITTNTGKIAVGLVITSDKPLPNKEKVATLAKQIAMHIAAMKPEALTVAELDPVKVQKEKDFVTEQARASGKPEPVIEKMIEGRIRKFYEEVVLLQQAFVINPEKTVSQALEDLSKELTCNLQLVRYVRMAVGG
jgi:elongation factor Ts